MSETEDSLLESAKALIESATRLKQDVQTLQDVHGQTLDGSGKLCRKIESEIKFLSQKLECNRLKESYVNCSNLPYLRSVHGAASLFPLVTSILTPFQPLEDIHDPSNPPNEEVPIVIDVVANEGFLWVKVVARSAEGLWNNWTGNCEMSHRSLEEQLEELLDLADLCPVYFRKPLLAIYFANGVMQQMADEIEEMGVQVFGTVKSETGECTTKSPENVFKTYPTQSPTQLNSRLLNQTFLSDYEVLNLDVSTLIAICSNLTHGHSNWIFENSKILNLQIRDEVQHSGQLWSELQKFMSGKKLVCCQTAYDSYSEILSIVGGPREKLRSAKLFELIEIVPDQTSPTISRLPVSSSVKERSKVIFGTGYELQTVTVTSNLSCVRSMRQMGVYFPVYAHVARALTEQKESSGVQVLPESQVSPEDKTLIARACDCFLCKNIS